MTSTQKSTTSPEYHDGTVSRVSRQEKNPERVNVFLDDVFAFGITLELAMEAGLRPGLTLTAAEQEALVLRDNVARARALALGYLADQARTAQEVRRKLRRKEFDDVLIDDVIAYLEERGYVDDGAYARAYVQGRFGGRGHGPARLRAELARRGVARDSIDGALQDVLANEDMEAAAVAVARPRWRALAAEADPRRRRQKTLDFLLRRGFGYDDAREAVQRIAAEEGAGDSVDFEA